MRSSSSPAGPRPRSWAPTTRARGGSRAGLAAGLRRFGFAERRRRPDRRRGAARRPHRGARSAGAAAGVLAVRLQVPGVHNLRNAVGAPWQPSMRSVATSSGPPARSRSSRAWAAGSSGSVSTAASAWWTTTRTIRPSWWRRSRRRGRRFPGGGWWRCFSRTCIRAPQRTGRRWARRSPRPTWSSSPRSMPRGSSRSTA